MAAPVGAHPSAETLLAFGQGKLDDFTAQGIIAHLAGCSDCARVIASQSGDDFLERLRQAQRAGSTPVPMKLAGRDVPAPTTLPPQAAPKLASVPSELAGNEQYEVLRELGRGGMGVVYLARNRLLDRHEVLKVVNQDLLTRVGGKERFLREIQSAAKLNHPNVVTAYNAMQLGELLFFAMEYVEGEDLAQVVKARGALPVVNACYYVQQAALGLQHAWDKQMVHRDIKPQNLILARVGKRHVVKILDFGLAKVVREQTEESALTGAGKMLGTPDYIAPEQAMDAARADIRADIYSLGCTFYYLLTASPPFKGKTLYAILQAHQTEAATPVNTMRPEVPASVASVLGRMMAKDPAERYQKPIEVAQALAPLLKAGAKALTSGSILMSAPVNRGTEQKASPGAETVLPAVSKRATMTERPGVVLQAKHAPSNQSAPRRRRRTWWIALGVALPLFCLAGFAMWAGGVFSARSGDMGKLQPTPNKAEKDSAPSSVAMEPPPAVPKPAAPEKGEMLSVPLARAAYQESLDKARERVLGGFESAMARAPAKAGLLSAERARFENRGFVPWSEPMRPFLGPYLASLRDAQARLRIVLEELRRQQSGAESAQLSDFTSLVAGVVVARWMHQPLGFKPGMMRLYSNGTINHPDSKDTWAFRDNKLILRWPNAQAPGGFWVDTCTISPDGFRYSGTNQRGRPISGTLVKD